MNPSVVLRNVEFAQGFKIVPIYLFKKCILQYFSMASLPNSRKKLKNDFYFIFLPPYDYYEAFRYCHT